MRVNGNQRSRVKPNVVSITLSDWPSQSAKPDRAGLSQLSPGELKILREKRGMRWTAPERAPPSSITVDQLSITGMSLVFNPGAFWLRRAIWLCIIICLLIWLCVQLRLCVLRLSQGGTVRTWSRRTVADIPLPAITVCHGNRFKKSVVLRHQLADGASWPSWHQLGYQTLNWSSFDGLDQFYNTASYSWNDMVLSCKVGGKSCSDIGTFRTVPTLLNGMCTTFNTNVTVTKRLASSQINLVLQENEPLDEFEHNAWKVFLHPQDVYYSDIIFFSGLVASVKVFGNRMHQVKVHRTITEELPNGFGDGCNATNDALCAYKKCIGVCLMTGMRIQVASKAHESPLCAVPWVGKGAYGSDPPPCRSMEELEGSSMGTHKGVNEEMFVAWASKCPCTQSCRSDRYHIEEHEKWHIDETSIYLSYPLARGGTHGAVMLWLSDVEEHIDEREAYSVNTFIAEVGGNLGLMLGGSLLTLVEIIDCVVATCLSRRQKRARQQH